MKTKSQKNKITLLGKVIGVAAGKRRGESKVELPYIDLKADSGVIGDAHCGTKKQVSLVSWEDILYMNKAYNLNAGIGAFAENIVTQGIHLTFFSPGDRIRVGQALLEVICIGKYPEEMKNHTFSYKGHTLLPKRGLFCKVIKGGRVKPGDMIKPEKNMRFFL